MCGTDHPGHLIDVKAESLAVKGALFTRTLAHHAEVGLSGKQVKSLLAVSADYHDRQNDLRIEMAQLAERVEHKGGRLDTEALELREQTLARRAELFAADEALFFELTARGHALLTDEQIHRLDAIHQEEKDADLRGLTAALDSAVGPTYSFGKA